MMLPLRNFGQFGVIQDTVAQALPVGAWSDARNVRFTGVEMQKMLEAAQFTPITDFTPKEIQLWADGFSSYVAVVGESEGEDYIYWLDRRSDSDVGTWVEVGGPYASDGQWQSFEWGDTCIFNNGINAPQMWDGTALQFIDLPNWGLISTADDIIEDKAPSKNTRAACTILLPFKGFLVACGITESGTYYPNKVWWSDTIDLATYKEGGPPSWDYESPSTNSAQQEVGLGDGKIRTAAVLNENLIIYTDGSATAMQFVGGRLIMGLVRLFGKGAASLKSVVEYNSRHFVVSRDQIYTHDGTVPKLVAKDRVESEFFSRIGKGGRFGDGDVDWDILEVLKNPDRKEIMVGIDEHYPAVVSAYDCGALGDWADDNAEAWWPMDDPQTLAGPDINFIRGGGTEDAWVFATGAAAGDWTSSYTSVDYVPGVHPDFCDTDGLGFVHHDTLSPMPTYTHLDGINWGARYPVPADAGWGAKGTNPGTPMLSMNWGGVFVGPISTSGVEAYLSKLSLSMTGRTSSDDGVPLLMYVQADITGSETDTITLSAGGGVTIPIGGLIDVSEPYTIAVYVQQAHVDLVSLTSATGYGGTQYTHSGIVQINGSTVYNGVFRQWTGWEGYDDDHSFRWMYNQQGTGSLGLLQNCTATCLGIGLNIDMDTFHDAFLRNFDDYPGTRIVTRKRPSPAVTIPQEASVDYPLNTVLTLRQAGTGTLTLTTTGLTINGTVPSWAQHVEVRFRKVAADTWDVI